MKARRMFVGGMSLVVALWWLAPEATPQGASSALPVGIIVTASEAEARSVLGRLERGEDFGALAKGYSIDPSGPDGGYLGSLRPDEMRQELRDALKGVTAGRISGIVRIPSGYAILKVLERPLGTAPSVPTKRQAIAAAGTVRLTYDYGGFASALAVLQKFAKPAGWDRDLRTACTARVESAAGALGQLQGLIAGAGAQPKLVRDANALSADLHAYRGEMDEAIQAWQASYQVALGNFPDRAAQFEESLGVAYLHKAGLVLYQDFVFPRPLARGMVREPQRLDLKRAQGYFLRYLKREPADGEVRWLLNLSYMLSGEYPGGVPKEFLMGPAVWESKEDVVHFRDVAGMAGVGRRGQAGGAIVEDFDNDGVLDILVSSVNDCEALAYYHGNGDGTFTDRTAAAGLAGITGGLNIIQTDYNNDGCKDVLVLRGGWEYPRPKTLLRNNCNGTFTDVTAGSGLEEPLTATQTAVWVDIDNDGKLDLFVGNENAASQLFLNRGDGKFVDIAVSAGVSKAGFTKAVVAADYDNDGYVDLYVSSLNGEHHLFHNNHDRTFTDVTAAAGVEGPWASFGAWFFDYDNDGLVDLFVANNGTSVDDAMRGFNGQPQSGEKLRLFHNVGGGKFRDVTVEAGLDRAMMSMGLNFGDIDNDGFLDFYLGSGNPSYASPIPNALFHNQGGKRFVDITASSGTGILPKGHGVAFADLDRDGDADLFVVMGGAVPGDRQMTRLFENPGNGNDWINVRLVGVKSNRAGVGARIRVTVRDGGAGRAIWRTVGSGGSFGASPFEQHIGLGKAARIESLEVWWPASGTRQRFGGVWVNHFVEVEEFSKAVRILERKAFRLGGVRGR